jgi:hypothetical protein
VTNTTGPLHGYELAFLEAGGVLVRDGSRHLILMWLCRIPWRDSSVGRAPGP